ncbi:MAG: helix-turn-helix transcriptional regulator [Myxococcota bacterium]
MPIVVDLAVIMAKRRVSSKELAAHINITPSNLSLLKRGHVRGVRFRTLEQICEYLECQPGDILRYQPEDPGEVPKS